MNEAIYILYRHENIVLLYCIKGLIFTFCLIIFGSGNCTYLKSLGHGIVQGIATLIAILKQSLPATMYGLIEVMDQQINVTNAAKHCNTHTLVCN